MYEKNEAYGKKALLVVDMVNDFVDQEKGTLVVPGADELVDPMNRLIEAAYENDVKVFYICDSHAPDDREFENWDPHAVKGTWGAQLAEGLAYDPEKGTIVEKTTISSFYGTDLEEKLEEYGIQEIYEVGVVTNICVLMAGAEALFRDNNVKKATAVKDCVAALPDETGRYDDNDYFFNRQAGLLSIGITELEEAIEAMKRQR